MSSETSAWAKEQRCGDPVTKAVLREIANWAKPTGICEFLSVKRISQVTEVSTRTVQRHIARLEQPESAGGLGMIKRIHRHRDDGGQGANCFELVGYKAPAGALDAPRRQSVTPPCQNVTPPRQIDGGPGDTGVTRLGDKIIPPSPPSGGDTPKGADKPAGGDAKKGSRIAMDWSPPLIDALPRQAQAAARQWPSGAYPAEAEAFLNYWLGEAGAKARKVDWDRTWANRVVAISGNVLRSAKAGVRHAVPAADVAAIVTGEAVAEKMLEGGMSDGLRKALRKALGGAMYDTWFGPAALLIKADALHVVARTEFARAYIEANLAAALNSAMDRSGIPDRLIVFEVSHAIACARQANNEKLTV